MTIFLLCANISCNCPYIVFLTRNFISMWPFRDNLNILTFWYLFTESCQPIFSVCVFYHTFLGHCAMWCDVILCKYKNYSITAMLLCYFICAGVNGKWFGFSEFFAIFGIMKFPVIQLSGVCCILNCYIEGKTQV